MLKKNMPSWEDKVLAHGETRGRIEERINMIEAFYDEPIPDQLYDEIKNFPPAKVQEMMKAMRTSPTLQDLCEKIFSTSEQQKGAPAPGY